MRFLSVLLLSGAMFVLAACGGDDVSDPDIRPDSVVSMALNSFAPFTLEILVGGTAIFDFGAEPHNVIFERKTGAPADIQVTTNSRVGRTFNTAGTFPYECRIHPGMIAEVVVRD